MRTRKHGWEIVGRAAFLAALTVVAAPFVPQLQQQAGGAWRAEIAHRALAAAPRSAARDSFEAIQKQIEAARPGMIRSTVGLRTSGGSGSGVILSRDGLILTAAHVIGEQPGRRLTVILDDGRRLPATTLGADPRSDLGLVQVSGDTDDLPAAPLGDSSSLRKGQWVVATGHPLGTREGRPPVLRAGRVWGTSSGRRRGGGRRIATDAPLISGDSGGPLFDLNGRVVGINSMITSSERVQASIHVPANLAKTALGQARAGQAPDDWSGPPATFTAALRDGRAAFQTGEVAVALRAARGAVVADPTSASARLLLARALARGGQSAPATVALREAIERGENDAEAIRSDRDLAPLTRDATVARLLDRADTLNGIPGDGKGDTSLLEAAASVPPPGGNRGVVRVRANGKTVALGTVVSEDGDVLTKASELPVGARLECVLPDGRAVPAERRAGEGAWDVALLKIRTSGLRPVAPAGAARVGRWTFSPDHTGAPASVGVVGVAAMPVRGRGIAPQATSKAFMGVAMEPVALDTLRTLGLRSGVRVAVSDGLPAARAGMRDGDVLFEAEGRPVGEPDTLMDLLVGKEPGDQLRVRVWRDGERLSLTVNLAARPSGLPGRGGLPELLSGEVSRMAGPFPRVLHHDAVLKPGAMGGPLLDADGRFLGLNIARADRTSTYAIRADDVANIYARLKAAR